MRSMVYEIKTTINDTCPGLIASESIQVYEVQGRSD